MKTCIKSFILMAMMFMTNLMGASIQQQEKFDWSQVLQIPPGAHLVEGNQILHFKAKNKYYGDDAQAKKIR